MNKLQLTKLVFCDYKYSRPPTQPELLPAPPDSTSREPQCTSTRVPLSPRPTPIMTAEMDIDFTRRNKKPRPLSEHEKEKLDEFVDAIHYSARWVVYLEEGWRVLS